MVTNDADVIYPRSTQTYKDNMETGQKAFEKITKLGNLYQPIIK